ncbi:MAG: translation elongation factor Ts [Bernardetiaceae bacterium]|jgi:elongation factor Ts|nr:translation elongation factor Ts [Bernardetiaceae bacterium]
MSITAADVNKLRQATGAGMMDCKKALTEAAGDFEAAIDILRKKGQKISAARADRSTTEGVVFIATAHNDTEGYVFSLGCETDFVAKNTDFVAMGNLIMQQVLAHKPANLEAVNALVVDGRPIAEHLVDLVGKIGEKIEVVQYATITGEKIVTYLHSNQKVGVLVALKGGSGAAEVEAGKDVTMQIAAMKPIALDKDDVDPTVIQREIEIGKEQARAEGKPEAMLEKIALGKLTRFYKDNTLLNQDFVKDNKVSIAQYLDSVKKGLTVSAFSRVGIGQ